ncbi:hypothetical protein [Pseudidiomarina aquimaris]|uniref:hypothetical protein n=1 Tax=Pseudidiomarina aquimaris TaxID=641841 RepID=UPI003A96CAD6
MKIATLIMAVSLALTGSAFAQDQAQAEQETDRNPQTGKEIKDAQRAGKFKAGKALADTVKAKAPDPDYLDDDDDGDGLGDVDGDGVGDLAREEAHEAAHTVQQKEGADATKRKRPGRTKYGDITLKKGATAAGDATDTDEKPKKADKKKGDNN